MEQNNTKIWRCRDITFDLTQRTLLMGILNVTPDSFSDGGCFFDPVLAVERALQMEHDGADIIDVGGESTRPNSEPVSEEQELQRVIPVIERLADRVKIPISIDTVKSRVAEEALRVGARIVNDISGMRFDSDMPKVVAEFQAGVVLMHIKGTPKTMQKNPYYDDLLREIKDYLQTSMQIAQSASIPLEQIVIDPGIGFGKTIQDNFTILRHLETFQELRRPILIGPSRKSFLGGSVDQRLEGTAAAVSAAIFKGADVVRVHDVREMLRVVKIADIIKNKGGI